MKFTDFCYHGNKGGSSENLNDSIGQADPENLHRGAKLWDLSYTVKSAVPENPIWRKYLDDISYTS